MLEQSNAKSWTLGAGEPYHAKTLAPESLGMQALFCFEGEREGIGFPESLAMHAFSSFEGEGDRIGALPSERLAAMGHKHKELRAPHRIGPMLAWPQDFS
jgi:hypothetical protein